MRTFITGPQVTPSMEVWEEAYRRFETPEQEIAKFVTRLHAVGADAWPRGARIVELFCGRGGNLNALARLGFTNLEGIDLSPRLAALYDGPGKIVVGDCRALPWADATKDLVIVQGGLHHLPDPTAALDQVLAEARRVLAHGGRFVAVEPWLTPYLQVVHLASFSRLRKVSAKLNAFATMVEHERETYERWLAAPAQVRALLARHFRAERLDCAWGKLVFVGVR